MTTFSAKPHEVRRDWYLIDASGKVLGRLAVEIARRLPPATSEALAIEPAALGVDAAAIGAARLATTPSS